MIPARKNLKIKLLLPVLLAIVAFSCTNNEIYFKYKNIPLQGWNKDSICTFEIPVTNTSVNYDVYIKIRNRGEYPHQNLWLFITKITPDSVVSKDTINFYLADQRGKWIGSGVGSVFEMPVIYQQNYHFPKVGKYTFEIAQGMRDSILIGINDVGMMVEKEDRK